MLKVLRTTDSNIVFTLIGRLEAENMADVRGLLAAEPPGSAVVLDLADLVLLDRDGMRFLRTCERDGIVLRNCPQYIRTWMESEEEQ
jgi:anti-anti-sigma regulatory factor